MGRGIPKGEANRNASSFGGSLVTFWPARKPPGVRGRGGPGGGGFAESQPPGPQGPTKKPPLYARLKSFSSSYLLILTFTGLPWGQYWMSPLWTLSTRTRSSRSSLTMPALMAALQAMVWSMTSRALSGSARPVRSSSAAISSRAGAIAAASISAGQVRQRMVLSPKSSASKPKRLSRSRCSSRAAYSPAARVTVSGTSSCWPMMGAAAAFMRSKLTRSWAACLSMR